MAVTKVVQSNNPAAGAETLFTVPAGTWYRLLSAYVQCVQGITQTPNPTLVVDDGANIVARSPSFATAQAASTTEDYSFGPGHSLTGVPAATGGVASAPFPVGLILAPGYRVRTLTGGIGANTDFGIMSLLVVEFVQDPSSAQAALER